MPTESKLLPDVGNFPFFRHTASSLPGCNAGKSETARSTAGKILLNDKKYFSYFPLKEAGKHQRE